MKYDWVNGREGDLREMKQDSERRSIGGQNDDFGNTSVERLCSFVGALFQLAVVRGLLDEVEDFLGEGCVGDGPGCFHSFRQ